MIQHDLADLLEVFDELSHLTNEQTGYYVLKQYREDGVIIQFSFSLYQRTASIIVHANEEVEASSLTLASCTNIRVLDITRKCLEVLAGKEGEPTVRAFLALDGDSILSVENEYQL